MNYLGHLCSCHSADMTGLKDIALNDIYEGRRCLTCPDDKCQGFAAHSWRNVCQNCKCVRYAHDVNVSDGVDIYDRLGLTAPKDQSKQVNADKAAKLGYKWVPPGLSKTKVDDYMQKLEPRPTVEVLQLVVQLPLQDLAERFCRQLTTDEDKKAFDEFRQRRNVEVMDVGCVCNGIKENTVCRGCEDKITAGELAVMAPKAGIAAAWHPACFACKICHELLVDLCYCVKDGHVYCERHYAELIKPRCYGCDELIFSEVTKAMNRDWHSGHFACFKCDTDLIGNRYVIQDGRPYCTGCYESLFGSTCAECKEIIGIGAKDLTYKELHWHEKCFFCCDCKKSLVGESFGTQEDKLYCSECHDNNFAPRCDFCKEVFRSGVKKFEWGGKKWHEQCFHCDECKEVIADHSFVPHEEKAVCVPCFERLYAPKCTKCEGVISKSGITYKSSPWHRECFTCTHCTITLAGETFTSQDDKPYCAPCYGELFAKKCQHCRCPLTAASRCGADEYRSTCCESCYGQLFAKKCNQCLKPITGPGTTKFVTFEERHWHSECFICHKCNTSLTGQGFILDDTNNVLCARCAPL